VIFKKGNKIKFGQDHSFWQGVPPGVDFEVTPFPDNRFVLRAPGYGIVGGDYGNGALYVYGLSKKQIKRFEKEVKKEPI
jgi:hypothetical protein